MFATISPRQPTASSGKIENCTALAVTPKTIGGVVSANDSSLNSSRLSQGASASASWPPKNTKIDREYSHVNTCGEQYFARMEDDIDAEELKRRSRSASRERSRSAGRKRSYDRCGNNSISFSQGGLATRNSGDGKSPPSQRKTLSRTSSETKLAGVGQSNSQGALPHIENARDNGRARNAAKQGLTPEERKRKQSRDRLEALDLHELLVRSPTPLSKARRSWRDRVVH